MSNAIYEKPMENVRNRIIVKVINNEKYYLKRRLKSYYMLQKILDNNLVVIRKMKIILILNKPAYTGMCVLDLSKVLMYELHYDYIKNRYGSSSGFLFIDTDSLMYEIKSEDVYEYFSSDKEIFDFSNYWTKSKKYGNSKKLIIDKFKDKTTVVAIKEFVELKPKMYSFLVEDNSKHKKGLDKNLIAVIRHN